MSDQAGAAVPAARTRRNDPCPCGSGRKFKLCCGRAGARAAGAGAGMAAPPAVAAAPPRHGEDRTPPIGPLTEATRERQAAEAFRQAQSALPEALFSARGGKPRAPSPGRIAAAERQRQRGARLRQAGRSAAALAAFRQAADLAPADAASHHALGRALLEAGRPADAAASLGLAAALGDDAAAHYDLATALHRQHLYPDAMAAYRRAAALAPQLSAAHDNLGELLEAAGEMDEAASCFRRAAAAAPGTNASRLSLARALMLEGDFGRAELRLRQAIELDPDSDVLHKFLGDTLARTGRFEPAIEAFDCALRLNPRLAHAHFAAVEAKRGTGADRPRLAQMLALLAKTTLDDDGRAHLHFAIGKLSDDLGEYEAAMRHFDAANRIRGRDARFDAAAFAADVDRLVRRFTPARFAADAAFGCDDETPLLIVGMPRSGTTLVEQILSSHPQIAGGGELSYWIKRASPWGIAEARYLDRRSAHDLSAEYLALLRRLGPNAARVTDKLPFNVLCVGLIHLLLPKARIIQCRRHPVDTCLSIYFTNFAQTIPFACGKADLAAAYRQYARLMDHWRTVLPPDRLFEVDYEQLIADREAVSRRLIAFSGVGWDDFCLQPERNGRAVTTASVWQARQPVYTTSVARWRHYEPWLGELRGLLEVSD